MGQDDADIVSLGADRPGFTIDEVKAGYRDGRAPIIGDQRRHAGDHRPLVGLEGLRREVGDDRLAVVKLRLREFGRQVDTADGCLVFRQIGVNLDFLELRKQWQRHRSKRGASQTQRDRRASQATNRGNADRGREYQRIERREADVQPQDRQRFGRPRHQDGPAPAETREGRRFRPRHPVGIDHA